MKKKILLAIIVIVFNILAVGTINVSAVSSGTCGDTLTWELSESGVLAISGIGAMHDFTQSTSPWEDSKDIIKEIVIEEGITHIGENAFCSFTNLKIVHIPSSLCTIGHRAFPLHEHRDVLIADLEKWCSVKIGADANPLSNSNLYVNNKLVEHLIIPEQVTHLSSGIFWGCYSIKEVTLHENIIEYYDYWFECCDNLQEIHVAENNLKYSSVDGNLLSKDGTIFYKYANGKNNIQYEVPSTVTKIEGHAFYDCRNIECIILSEGVEEICDSFRLCHSLKEITIPKSIKTIKAYAFFLCDSLKKINYASTEDDWNKIVIDEQGNEMLINAYGLSNLPANSCGKTATWSLDANGVLTISGTGAMLEFQQNESPWEDSKDIIKEIVVEEGITHIGANAFYSLTNLKMVQLPLSVIKVNPYAFHQCNSLKKINYAGTEDDWSKIVVEHNNDSLIKAHELSNLPENSCGKTATWSLDTNGVLTISGTGAMLDSFTPWNSENDTIKEIVIEEGITHIGENAFYSLTNVEIVKIPSSIVSIGSRVFNSNLNKSVYITDLEKFCNIKFTRWGYLLAWSDLYFNNELVEHLVIPENVTEISAYAFWGCTSIKKINIHKDFTGEYNSCFEFCCNLQQINVDGNNTKYGSIDGNLVSKDKKIFYQYALGKESACFVLPDGIEKINEKAFQGCENVQSIILTEGVEEIGQSAFFSCVSLKEITFPKTIKMICQEAFWDCPVITTINYCGTIAEWNEIIIEKWNDPLLNATINLCYAKTSTTVSEDKKSFTITPINIENGKTVILALYDGDKFVEFQKATYEGEEITFTTDKIYTDVKVMVWNDLTNLKPVCSVEELN